MACSWVKTGLCIVGWDNYKKKTNNWKLEEGTYPFYQTNDGGNGEFKIGRFLFAVAQLVSIRYLCTHARCCTVRRPLLFVGRRLLLHDSVSQAWCVICEGGGGGGGPCRVCVVFRNV